MHILSPTIEKLNNPVWFSLSETHHQYALGNERIKCYYPEYCPFGGIVNQEVPVGFLMSYSGLTGDFYIVGECPQLPDTLKMTDKLNGLQMIIHKPIHQTYTEEIFPLGNEYLNTVETLINLVQPGYFKKKTFLLGDYYGISVNNVLVAVTGERMQMDDFTEVSAVVTHPQYTGKGFAKQLVAYTVNQVFAKGKTPFLHVLKSNLPAIALYEKLGFTTRRKMNFWKIELADK
jgi:ribosomal protein S18 acetylase RimI-like enzyme